MMRNELSAQERGKLHAACARLFSAKATRQNGFWEHLSLDSVKRAYRAKALRYHPDRFATPTAGEGIAGRGDFVRIHESYRVLCTFLNANQEMAPLLPTKKVIAVGGSKGGVGKSIFSVNLGVVLAGLGKKVVLVDLDLGGANLHLYLNQVKPRRTLSTFLERRVLRLEAVLTPSAYGPHLIAGGNRNVGLRQVTFAQKINIIKSIKRIEADYVIMDLGGNTAFNTLDFFNAADYGIVVSTCDPAAYLETINFTRAAFYRHILRVFTGESPWRVRRQVDLEDLIQTVVGQSHVRQDRSMWELAQRVKKEQPHNLQLLRDIVGAYNVNLVINAAVQGDMAGDIAAHVTKAARKILFVQMNYLGHLPHSETVANSARSFIPAVRTEPSGETARSIKAMLSRLDA